MTTTAARATLIAIVAAAAALGMVACTPAPSQPAPSLVDVVGDSTLFLSNKAQDIPGSRAFPGSSPFDAAGSVTGSSILWVYAGSNVGSGQPGVEDDVAAMVKACEGRRCRVAVEGVVKAYDDEIVRTFPLLCDLRQLRIQRPDGVHPDEAGARLMSTAIQACARQR